MASPIITVAQMREWEMSTWATGLTEESVIRQAGAAVAAVAQAVTHEEDTILVLAGKGHNGDDARLAAKQLRERELEVLPMSDPAAALPALRERMAHRPALIIDGLFGIGLNRPLSEEWIAVIRCLNESGLPILAVDTPSGLHADDGVPQPESVRATWTLTLGAVKRGLVQPTAWPYVGRLLVAQDIGLADCPVGSECELAQADDFTRFPPPRAIDAHKGSFGHLVIIAGSLGYHGAAVLASRGAQHAQPGLITLYTQEAVYVPVAAQLQSVMVRPWPASLTLPPRCTGVVVGPGLADEGLPRAFKEAVGQLWAQSRLPIVADASALDWLPEGATPEGALRVMTPHPGEAARLLVKDTGEVQRDRITHLRALSARWGGAHVVLKGHQTISGRATGRILVNSSGNPRLAQGGSGDVLAGYLGGLLAQPNLQQIPAKAIEFGVWQHGACADWLDATQANWTVETLAGTLGEAPRADLII